MNVRTRAITEKALVPIGWLGAGVVAAIGVMLFIGGREDKLAGKINETETRVWEAIKTDRAAIKTIEVEARDMRLLLMRVEGKIDGVDQRVKMLGEWMRGRGNAAVPTRGPAVVPGFPGIPGAPGVPGIPGIPEAPEASGVPWMEGASR